MYKSTHEISFVLSRGSDESPPLLWYRQTSVRPAMRLHTVKSYKQLIDWFRAQVTKWQVQISRTKITSFFKKFLEDISPFCGATDTPVLDFWWCLLWVSKPEWAALFVLGGGVRVTRSLRFTKIIKREYPPFVATKPIFIGLNIGLNFVIYVNRPLVYPDSCYLVVEVLLDRLHGRTFLNDDASRTLNDLLDDGERWDDRRSDVEPHTLLTANICQS